MKNTEFSDPGGKPVEIDGFKGGGTSRIRFEAIHALFIAEGMPQQQRLERLNRIAIHQMTLLAGDERMKLPGGEE